jgi:hypothetical protein
MADLRALTTFHPLFIIAKEKLENAKPILKWMNDRLLCFRGVR